MKNTLMNFGMNLSKNRMKIYQMCLNEELNVSEITRRLKISYQCVINHLNILQDLEMIERKEVFIRGIRNIIIIPIPFEEGSLRELVYKARLKELEKKDGL